MITVNFKYLPRDHNPPKRILDIGCGSGRHTAAAFDLDCGLVIGADTNLIDLQDARSRLAQHTQWQSHKTGQWALAGVDICALPFANDVFDVVICSEVLEHIRNHHQAIQESIRVLKSNGILVVSVPETICWALSKTYRQSPGGHLRIYRTGPLIACIQRMGMKRDRIHFAHSLHTPYWWLKCLIGLENAHSRLLKAYHRLLVWDMMAKPPLTRWLERMLNPVLGKSVMYFTKKNHIKKPFQNVQSGSRSRRILRSRRRFEIAS